MSQVRKLAPLLLAGLLAGPLPAATHDPATAALSPETRALMIREMRSLSEAMARMHGALVTGDHPVVQTQARNIHDSFVLAQNLREDQRQEIRTRLPEPFLALDQRFHVMAAALAGAAERGEPDVERFWFHEMTRACQDCHRTFAPARFPGLVPAADEPDAH